MPACHRQPALAPAPLVQLSRRFTAECSQLKLSVQTDSAGWMARVSNSDQTSTLYSAYRCSLRAAQIAATEYAEFRTGSPQSMPPQLGWKESW